MSSTVVKQLNLAVQLHFMFREVPGGAAEHTITMSVMSLESRTRWASQAKYTVSPLSPWRTQADAEKEVLHGMWQNLGVWLGEQYGDKDSKVWTKERDRP